MLHVLLLLVLLKLIILRLILLGLRKKCLQNAMSQ